MIKLLILKNKVNDYNINVNELEGENMNKDITLLIMAAGMGSRFGGLKQIESVGPSKEFMIDYSVYDAIKAGFNKIVFIIKEENYDIFRETIGARVEPHINVEYCFQDLNNLPNGYKLPEGRIKPWGTAHAILSAKDKIHENFAIINADDFYGSEAFEDIVTFLNNLNSKNEYAVIGYEVEHTLTENGSVKRAVLECDEGIISNLIESVIEVKNEKIIATPLNGTSSFIIEKNTPVSLNMFGFSPSIFNYIEDNFHIFMEENINNQMTCEYLIPDLVSKLINNKVITVKMIPTKARWQGVTYKEDKPKVIEMIQEEIKKGKYEEDLWKNFKRP